MQAHCTCSTDRTWLLPSVTDSKICTCAGFFCNLVCQGVQQLCQTA